MREFSTIKPSRSWQQRFSQGFFMTVKAPRSSMHSKHLYSPQKKVERISEGLSMLLGSRLGILVAKCTSTAFAISRPRKHY
ncbi:DUF72 domain-containing protein [Microcoleus sp. F4-D5]|uniref:DUF72 domain-containing protein n=1 Tax=Microcoleus sp. F4-D5 TaxID=2818760 RepID=UPI004040A4ED